MSLQPSRLARWGRTVLGFLALAVMLGPSLAAFATSRIEVPAPTRPPVEVIATRPFPVLAAGSRAGAPPLHVGPTVRTPGLVAEAALRSRLNEAAARCALRASTFLVLSASVDKKGHLTDVKGDAGEDTALAACATAFVRQAGAVETRGPGTLEIGYFMGRQRH
jgi:hypothetical protein